MNIVRTERQLARLCKSLGNERRLRIMRLLHTRPARSVGDIAAAIKLSVPSTSKHLRILADASLVGWEQDGLIVRYSIAGDIDPAAQAIITRWQ